MLLPRQTQNQLFPLGLFSQDYRSAICVFSPRRNLESSLVTGVKKDPASHGDTVGKGMPASESSRPEDAAGASRVAASGTVPSSDGTAGKTRKLFAN